MAVLHPPSEPFRQHLVDVGQGHTIYLEECGNPNGKPALVLHGGPGSGCTPGMRRFFDPDVYRIVLFDQRGCGRSVPNASEPAADLSTNTTGYLLADIELIGDVLGVDRWLIYGHSWGSLLGLTYAIEHPEQVSEVVLAGVVVGDPSEITWLYRDIASARPEAYARFRSGVPVVVPDADLIDAYADALFAPDPEIRRCAAYAFSEWDWSTASAADSVPMSGRWLDPSYQLARARIVTHYFRHNCWLDSADLLDRATRLGSIPAVLVNGALDVQTPTRSAERLAKSWPGAKLVVVNDAGHSTGDEGMAAAIVQATDRFAFRD